MAKMRIYTVHINPSKKHPYEAPVFVEESFNFYAFVFREFWSFYNKLWIIGTLLLAFRLFCVIALELHILAIIPTFILTLGVMLYCGVSANDWRREKLRRQGYITIDIVTSDNPIGAERRYFERYFSDDNRLTSRDIDEISVAHGIV